MNKKIIEIANQFIPISDNPSLLESVDTAMNKGFRWGITYLVKDLRAMFPDENVFDMDIDDARSLLDKIKKKLDDLGKES